jgi:hypothetical protein
MTKEKGPEAIEMTEEELNDFRKRIEDKQLLETDYAHIGKMIEFVIWVQIKLQQSKISLNNLKRLLFGKSSEKSAKTAEENVSTELMSSMNMQTEGLEKPERSILPSSEKKSLKKMGTAGWRGARTRRMK